MIKRILLAVAGTPWTPVAMQQAISLAKLHNASITAVPFYDDTSYYSEPAPIGGIGIARRAAEKVVGETNTRVKTMVRSLEREARTENIPLVIEKVEKDPIETIKKVWRYQDILIFGLQGMWDVPVIRDPEYAIRNMIEAGVRPILAVPSSFSEIKKVMIAYSGSLESAKAMKRFTQMKLWPDMDVRIVHASTSPQASKQLLVDAREYLASWGIEATMESIQGTPDKLLPYAEEWGADLIVMGNSTKSILNFNIFGTNMFNILKNARQSALYLAK